MPPANLKDAGELRRDRQEDAGRQGVADAEGRQRRREAAAKAERGARASIRRIRSRGQGRVDQGAQGRRRARQPPMRHGEAFPGKDENARDVARRNFLALIFCLMVGTAALPHILMRYYTTPSVKEARQSVTWSLFFIFLLYFTAPALAVLVKFVVYTMSSARRSRSCRSGSESWTKVDPGAAVDGRRQQGRHRAAGGDRDRRRHRRARDARDRRPAVRDLRPGGGRRTGCGAVDGRRPAAHDRQRAVARPLLQDDRPERSRRPAA
jgi:hypothetical protein